MSHDGEFQSPIDQYILRRTQEVDAPFLYEASISARVSYESSRLSRIYLNERTVEMRRQELLKLFKRVDATEQFPKDQEQTGLLQEVTNVLKTVTACKRPEIVMRTEIVPMLPCKGYELPRKTLFIGGRGDYVTVSRPMEEDQLEELLEKTQSMEEYQLEEPLVKAWPMEEQLLLEYLAEQSEEFEKQVERNMPSRIQPTRKLKKSGKESEANGEAGTGPALPNCTLG